MLSNLSTTVSLSRKCLPSKFLLHRQHQPLRVVQVAHLDHQDGDGALEHRGDVEDRDRKDQRASLDRDPDNMDPSELEPLELGTQTRIVVAVGDAVVPAEGDELMALRRVSFSARATASFGDRKHFQGYPSRRQAE